VDRSPLGLSERARHTDGQTEAFRGLRLLRPVADVRGIPGVLRNELGCDVPITAKYENVKAMVQAVL